MEGIDYLMYKNTNTEKISVVLTVYNGELYLQECLESIMNQTLSEIEIICVNDASKDKTLFILEKYQKIDKRITIISNESNCGAGFSRNKGLDVAKGKYIIFLDADDVFEKDMLEKAYVKANEQEADICIFKENLFQNKEDYISYFYPYKTISKLNKMEYFSLKDINKKAFNLWNGWAWNKLFRKSFIEKTNVRFQEIQTTNDAYFVHVSMVNAKRIVFLDEILVHHRVGVKYSLSSSRDCSWECCCVYLKELRNYLIIHNMYLEYERSFINWTSNFLYWNYWTLNESNRKKLFYELKQHILDEFEFYKYNQEYYYNDFYYWFVQTIYRSDKYSDCKILIDATKRWIFMLENNDRKLEKLFEYLQKKQYHAAIWGAGERGKALLDKCKNKSEIIKVYDKDSQKVGQKIKEGYMVEEFNDMTSQGIDFIIVTNTSYFDSIAKTVKKVAKNIKIFNLDYYQECCLPSPVLLEECML